jgi:hypothetical protein
MDAVYKMVKMWLLKKPGGRKNQGQARGKFAAFPVPVFTAFVLWERLTEFFNSPKIPVVDSYDSRFQANRVVEAQGSPLAKGDQGGCAQVLQIRNERSGAWGGQQRQGRVTADTVSGHFGPVRRQRLLIDSTNISEHFSR